MNVFQIKAFMKENGLKPDRVTFLTEGTPMAESYCLSFERGMFEVYYFERDGKLGLCRFQGCQKRCRFEKTRISPFLSSRAANRSVGNAGRSGDCAGRLSIIRYPLWRVEDGLLRALRSQ